MLYLGIDVGSVSTDLVLLDNDLQVVEKLYLRTRGNPIRAVQEGLRTLKERYRDEDVAACGTTGSGRQIAPSWWAPTPSRMRLRPTPLRPLNWTGM